MPEPPRLSHEVLDLLSRERDIEPTPQDVRRRVLARARFEQRLTAPKRRGVPRTYFVVGGLSLAFAAGAAAAVRGLWLTAPTASPGSHETLSVASAPVAPTTAPAASVTSPAPSTAAPHAASARGPAPNTSSSRSTTHDTQAKAEAELGLLKRARAAVVAGNHSAALAHIDEHTRTYPSSRLREEREALRVAALSGAGRHAEARSAAARFVKSFPRSVLSAQMSAKASASHD